MRAQTYDEKVQSAFRTFLMGRFPEFSSEVTGRRIGVDFGGLSVSSSRFEWAGDYGDVHFVFRAWIAKGEIVSLRCVGVWQNWLAHENWSFEREADIRSRLPYEEELLHLIEGLWDS